MRRIIALAAASVAGLTVLAGLAGLSGALLSASALVVPQQAHATVTAYAEPVAPGSPINIGAFPATLTASDRFTIFWTNPADDSGIAAARYKFDTAPTSNTDGTRIAPVTDPGNATIGIIQALSTGGRTERDIFIWLEDGIGLLDYTTNVMTRLRPEGAPEDMLRVAGAERYSSSVETCKKIFPAAGSASAVLLANGTAVADALAGVPLGYVASGCILLIQTGSIPSVVMTEIQRVLPAGGKVYVLGGTNVIRTGVETMLTSAGYTTKRLAGTRRENTAVKIMEELDAVRGTAPSRVYLVNGYTGTPDAISVGPLAAFQQAGIALTESGDLSQVVRDYLNANQVTIAEVNIVGGTSVVPASTATLLVNAGYTVPRYSGRTRYDTSRVLANLFVDDVPLSPPGIGIANGSNFIDALPAGIHLAAQLYPLLLVPPRLSNYVCNPTYDFMNDNNLAITGGYAYGGEATLPAALEFETEAVISGIRPGC